MNSKVLLPNQQPGYQPKVSIIATIGNIGQPTTTSALPVEYTTDTTVYHVGEQLV